MRDGPFRAPLAVDASGITLDDDLLAVDRNGWRVHLTRREFQVLSLLYKGKGKPVTIQQMQNALWDTDAKDGAITPGAFGAYIYRLRRKIKALGLMIDNLDNGLFVFRAAAMPTMKEQT